MDGLFPPTALYAAVAVSVAVTARITPGSDGGRSPAKPWEPWLLHVPVLAAWLHLLGYLAWNIMLTERAPEGFDRVNLMIHLATMALVGLAGGWIFFRQSSKSAKNSRTV